MFSAISASSGLKSSLLINHRAGFRDCFFTALAHDKRVTFFDPQHRNKKQIEVMINPHVIGLVQTAGGAPLGNPV
jgi:hypothetical protein